MLVFFSGLTGEFTRRRSRRTRQCAADRVRRRPWCSWRSPEDGPPFEDPSTWAGYLHAFGFIGIVLFGFSAMIATAIALRGNNTWRSDSAWSFAGSGAPSLSLLPVLMFALETGTTVGVYGFFGATMIWVELARRLSNLDPERTRSHVGV